MNTRKEQIVTPKKQIYGLDYLRAIACIFVVAFHSSPILMDLWYARALHVFIFASAVPIFILISLFLTELKIAKPNYLIKKSYRLGKIYILWGWLIPFVFFLIAQLTSVSNKEFSDIINGQSIYDLIINGANWSYKVYGIYFLVYLVVLSWIYRWLSPYMKYYSQMRKLFYAFCLINLLLPFLPQSYQVLRESCLPFLVYLPLAKIIHYDYHKSINYQQKAIRFAFIYIVVAILEAGIIAMSNRIEFITYNYAPYSRLSIVFLALCLVYISLTITQKLSSKSNFLSLVSSCSLGIYLIHGFLIDYLRTLELNYSSSLFFITVFSLSVIFAAVIKELPYVKQILTL